MQKQRDVSSVLTLKKESEDECLGVMRADLGALLSNNYANEVIGILLPGACIYNRIIQKLR